MQRKENFGNKLLNEVTSLPNHETPNYKVAAAATAYLGLATLVSTLNCGSFSFYLNAAAALITAGVTANQYFEGAPLKTAKSTYTGFFGAKAKPAVNEQVRAESANSHEAEAENLTPALR